MELRKKFIGRAFAVLLATGALAVGSMLTPAGASAQEDCDDCLPDLSVGHPHCQIGGGTQGIGCHQLIISECEFDSSCDAQLAFTLTGDGTQGLSSRGVESLIATQELQEDRGLSLLRRPCDQSVVARWYSTDVADEMLQSLAVIALL